MVRGTLRSARVAALFVAFTLGAWCPAGAQTYVNARTHARLEIDRDTYSLVTRAPLPDGNIGMTTDTGKVSTVGTTSCLWAQTGAPVCSGRQDDRFEWWGDAWYRQRPLTGRYTRADGLELVVQPNGTLLVPALRAAGAWWTERELLCIDLAATGRLCNPVRDTGAALVWGQWEFTRR